MAKRTLSKKNMKLHKFFHDWSPYQSKSMDWFLYDTDRRHEFKLISYNKDDFVRPNVSIGN